MWRRRSLALIVVLTMAAVGCGGGSDREDAGGDDSSADGDTSTSTSVTHSTPPSTTAVGSPVTSPSTRGEWDVIVTASGRGGLIDSTEISDLEIVGGSGSAEPWLRFGLVLNYCCGEPNSVVFPPDQWTRDINGAALQIVGPACGGPVECTDSARRVQLTPFEASVVTFEVYRGSTADPASAGTFAADVTPIFHWVGDVIEPESIPIDIRLDITAPAAPPTGEKTPTVTAHLPVTVVGGGSS